MGLACSGAMAHGDGLDQAGWRADAAFAVQATSVQPQGPWPRTAMPGVLLLGVSPRPQDGRLSLDHGLLGMQVRTQGAWSAELALGLHAGDPAYVEHAAIGWQSRAWTGQDLTVVLGRQRLRFGPLIDAAGHMDPAGSMPLTKRAVFNEYWSENGLSWVWRPVASNVRVQAGVWAGEKFPAAPSGAWMPSVQVEWQAGGWGVEFFGARARPQGRGSALRSVAGAGHLHGALDCGISRVQRVCFDGISAVMGAGVQRRMGPWRLALVGLQRHESGWLSSLSGAGELDSRVQGGWADLQWQAAPQWRLNLRTERVVPRLSLSGAGVALLAREASLSGAAPMARHSLGASWALGRGLSLGAEVGSEHLAGSSTLTFAGLRLVWQGGWAGGLP